MEEEKFIELVYKSLKDEMTDSEKTQFNNAIASSTELRALKEEITLAWALSDSSDVNLDIDIESDLAKTKSKFSNPSKNAAKILRIPKILMSIAASLLLFFCAWFIFNTTAEEITQFAKKENRTIMLDDGSQIWLKQGSTLRYPQAFAKDKRELTLEGEAFFDVAKDPNRPFIIKTKDATITVLGTSFNIKEESYTTKIAVKSGEVEVKTKNQRLVINKNQVAKVTPDSDQISMIESSNVNVDYWRTGRFVYQNKTLGSILKELEELLNINYSLKPQSLLTCQLSILINSTDPEEVLNKICDTLDIQSSKTDEGVYIFEGGQCN